jgi:hypothetical protein
MAVSRRTVFHWQDGLEVLIGLWLLASPFVLGYIELELAVLNAIILGVFIAVTAFFVIVRFEVWEDWVDMAVGLWLVASPWVIGFASPTKSDPAFAYFATWNFILVGLATAGFAAWSLLAHRADGHAA